MRKNVGAIDTIIRVVLAIIIAALIFTKLISGTFAIILGIVAAALLITGLVGWCGLYQIIGIKTCKSKE